MLRVIAISLAVVAAFLALGITVARATLPSTDCTVTEARFATLAMEMSYDKAKGVLGCDGVLVGRTDYGEIVIEHYSWRGTAWPYGRLNAQFINKTLQGTSKYWLDLSISRSG